MANYQSTGAPGAHHIVAGDDKQRPTTTTVELRDDDSTIGESDDDGDVDDDTRDNRIANPSGNVPDRRQSHPPATQNQQGWNYFRVPTPNTRTVFEAWEMISVQPTKELEKTTRVLGGRFEVKATYRVAGDAYAGVRAVTCFSQADLEERVRRARQEHNGDGDDGHVRHHQRRRRRRDSSSSYSHHLASRLSCLPGCLPNKLGALVDSRFIATNKNPHVRREWKIVHLEEMDSVMTEEAGEEGRVEDQKLPGDSRGAEKGGGGGGGFGWRGWRGKSSSSSNGGKKRSRLFGGSSSSSRSREAAHQAEPVQKWLVILRGHETQYSERGFEALYTCSNPWLQVDEHMMRHRRRADLLPQAVPAPPRCKPPGGLPAAARGPPRS